MLTFDVADYHSWLCKLAGDMLPGSYYDSAFDDLVQEGRIAMWKASTTYDPQKGSLPSWVTGAARMRMKDVAHGHGRYTGHTGRRGWTDAMSPKVSPPVPLSLVVDNPDFDERRLRPSVAASVKHRYA